MTSSVTSVRVKLERPRFHDGQTGYYDEDGAYVRDPVADDPSWHGMTDIDFL